MKKYTVQTGDGFNHRFATLEGFEAARDEYVKYHITVVAGETIERHRKPVFSISGENDMERLTSEVFEGSQHRDMRYCGKCASGWILNDEEKTCYPCGCSEAVNNSYKAYKHSHGWL